MHIVQLCSDQTLFTIDVNQDWGRKKNLKVGKRFFFYYIKVVQNVEKVDNVESVVFV